MVVGMRAYIGFLTLTPDELRVPRNVELFGDRPWWLEC
jgi:hypothetical protein